MLRKLGAMVIAVLLLGGCAGLYVAGDAGAGQASSDARPPPAR